jgi:hypothetical protein
MPRTLSLLSKSKKNEGLSRTTARKRTAKTSEQVIPNSWMKDCDLNGMKTLEKTSKMGKRCLSGESRDIT